MTDDMTSFELQQEVDKILNRAETLSASTPDHSAEQTLQFEGVSVDENEGVKVMNDKKPIKFKVRRITHDGDKVEERNNDNKKKLLKNVQLQYDQHVNKINKINKEIDFLNKLLPPHNVEVDYQTRVKINKAVEKLKLKIDELDKKKYSLGITLSRLWRDFDDSDIWVRSVSGS